MAAVAGRIELPRYDQLGQTFVAIAKSGRLRTHRSQTKTTRASGSFDPTATFHSVIPMLRCSPVLKKRQVCANLHKLICFLLGV
jgi:hypothetical protein